MRLRQRGAGRFPWFRNRLALANARVLLATVDDYGLAHGAIDVVAERREGHR